jgi:hypothetical protein
MFLAAYKHVISVELVRSLYDLVDDVALRDETSRLQCCQTLIKTTFRGQLFKPTQLINMHFLYICIVITSGIVMKNYLILKVKRLCVIFSYLNFAVLLRNMTNITIKYASQAMCVRKI